MQTGRHLYRRSDYQRNMQIIRNDIATHKITPQNLIKGPCANRD